MFGLGFTEILVICVVVLIVFGPERLPGIARTLGQTMAQFRRSVDEFKYELMSAPVDSPTDSSGKRLTTTPVTETQSGRAQGERQVEGAGPGSVQTRVADLRKPAAPHDNCEGCRPADSDGGRTVDPQDAQIRKEGSER